MRGITGRHYHIQHISVKKWTHFSRKKHRHIFSEKNILMLLVPLSHCLPQAPVQHHYLQPLRTPNEIHGTSSISRNPCMFMRKNPREVHICFMVRSKYCKSPFFYEKILKVQIHITILHDENSQEFQFLHGKITPYSSKHRD